VIVEATFSATMILGGQIKGTSTRLLQIYREGNFVEASDDTPLFQISAMQYGRPILVRAFDLEMSFEDAVKLLMVSFDSTIKANLSVNLPLNLHVYTADSLKHGKMTRIEKK
jgi:putative proteasome-type protease